MLIMRLILLSIILYVRLAECSEQDEPFSCDSLSWYQFCNSSLLDRDVLDLHEEAKQVVNCLNGNIQETDFSKDILVPEEFNILFKKLQCILVNTRNNLNCEGNRSHKCRKIIDLFCSDKAMLEDKTDKAREIFHEYKCVLCLVEYSSEIIQSLGFNTLNKADLDDTVTTRFLSLLTFLQLEMKNCPATPEANSWIERFINIDDWGECLNIKPHERTDIKNTVRLLYRYNRIETDYFNGNGDSEESLNDKYLITVVTITVIIITHFVGNVVLLYVFLSEEDHRNSSNLILLNLTVSYVSSLIINYIMFFVPPDWARYVQMNPNYILYVFSSSFFVLLLIYFTTTQVLKRCFSPSFFQVSDAQDGGSFIIFKALPLHALLFLSRALPVLIAIPYSTCTYQYLKTQTLFNFTALAITPVATVAINSVTSSWRQGAEDDCRKLIARENSDGSVLGSIKLLGLLFIVFLAGYAPVYLIDMLSLVPDVFSDISYTAASLLTFSVVVITYVFNPILFHNISGNFRRSFNMSLGSRFK